MANDRPGAAYLLSIGASEFPDPRYGRRPSVAGSALGLTEALAANSVWDIPRHPDAVLTGHVTARESLEALKRAAREPADLLIVYLGCHGSRFPGQPDELQLAFSDADFEYFATHLPFSQVKDILRRAVAPRRLLLLDCCYADDSFLGTVRDTPMFQVTGVCTLTATEHRVEANAAWKDTGHTAFAGALIEILEQGIPRAPRQLTIDRVFRELRNRLAQHDLPLPGMRGDADRMVLCHNRHPDYTPLPTELPEAVRNPSSLIVTLAPAAFANHLRPGSDGAEPADAEALLRDFVRLRPLADVAHLAAEFIANSETERAAAVADQVLTEREHPDFLGLVHALHEHRALGTQALSELLHRRSAEDFVTVLGGLLASTCRNCSGTGQSLARLLAADCTTARWAELLAALRGEPGLDIESDLVRDGLLDALTADRLSALAAGLWSTDEDQQASPESRRDAIEAIERAAAAATPAQVYTLAAGLAGDRRRELGNCLLEAAADRLDAFEVAELLHHAASDAGYAELLRRTALHRHSPRYLVEVLDALEIRSAHDGPGSRDALVDCAADRVHGLSARDLARVFLLLLHRGRKDALAVALDAALRHRTPEQMADSAVQLYRYGGRAAAGLLIGRLVRSGTEDIGKAIEVLRLLQGRGEAPLVNEMVGQAARGLRLDHAFHVACLLAGLGLQETARNLVRTVLPLRTAPSAAAGSLAESLDVFLAEHRPEHEQLSWLLSAIAEPCTVDQAWDLITWARRGLRGGEAAVLTAVCRIWPVARIEELADFMRRKLWDPTARQLMDQAVAVFAEERARGRETAELIMALRRQADRRAPRHAAEKLCVSLAAKRDPEQVMMLIDRLAAERAYDQALHKPLRDAVLGAFKADELIRLPEVRRTEHLTVVQDIEMEALLSPARVAPERVPAVLRALRAAGTSRDDLVALCRFVGARRRVDRTDVVSCLRGAGLRAEADAYESGDRLSRPKFFDP